MAEPSTRAKWRALRSARVSTPKKYLTGATLSERRFLCAGVNRHEAENAKFLRERSSDPLGPESCAATARDTVKRRQGDRRGGLLRCGNIQSGRRRLIK